MGRKSIQMRTAEQLNDKEKVLNGMEYVCRVSLLCLVARPRTWEKWSIVESESTMWQRADTNRVVQKLFAQNAPAILAMNELALQVRRREESELSARKTSPEDVVSNKIVEAVQSMADRQAKREEEMMAQQRQMFDLLTRRVVDSSPSPHPIPQSLPPRPEEVATVLMTPASSSLLPPPLPNVREKRKAQVQTDVAYYSDHPTLRAAFEYARDELYPMEKEQGAAWRVIRLSDGREDKSRDRQWRFYRELCIAVATVASTVSSTTDGALDNLQSRRETFSSVTAFNAALRSEQAKMSSHDKDACVRRAFGP